MRLNPAIVIGAALIVLLAPPALEFVTGEATFNAEGIAIELSELVTQAITIVSVFVLIRALGALRKDRDTIAQHLSQSREENARWRESSKAQMDGARQAIDKQFDAWRFTVAEKEIAGLLLKGCSHKQIAELREANAATVRQQSQSIYRKSGLENRSELAAYFLDAILHPEPNDASRTPAP
jgi:DNA-binding CsgD family transcriptional regulator